MHLIDNRLETIFGALDRLSSLFELRLEVINKCLLASHCQLHVVYLATKCLQLRGRLLRVFNPISFELSHLIKHDVEDIFVRSLPIEYCIHEFLSVNLAVFQLCLLFLKILVRVLGHFGEGLNHFITDPLDARFHVEPVELVDLFNFNCLILSFNEFTGKSRKPSVWWVRDDFLTCLLSYRCFAGCNRLRVFKLILGCVSSSVLNTFTVTNILVFLVIGSFRVLLTHLTVKLAFLRFCYFRWRQFSGLLLSVVFVCGRKVCITLII